MRTLLTAVLILQLCSAAARARGLENWPYEKLFAGSDLVVIADPLSTVDTADVFDHEGNSPEDYTGMNTEFRVLYALKGDAKAEKFGVLHFRYSNKAGMINDGALFVQFRLKAYYFSGLTNQETDKDGIKRAGDRVKMSWPKPAYLLFLKRRPDGRYEPLSGQFDSELSCREVSGAEENPYLHDQAGG